MHAYSQAEEEQVKARAEAEEHFKLGEMYYNGEGVVKDLAEAARLYRLAADQGDAAAQHALAQNSFGRLHRKGAPVPKEAATPKVPASLYMLISGQVPWVARTQAHART
jgi:hypothetical protein